MDPTARETLKILDQGWYPSTGGRVSINELQQLAVQNTCLIRPSELPGTRPPIKPRIGTERTVYSVTLENTQSAARRLVQEEGVTDLCVLNFASAKKVCGGFLRGARAQEEDLARSSGLYRCLETQPDYYEENQSCGSFLYTDHMIYSPDVPWFRANGSLFLEEPFTASIISSPAPNAKEYYRKKEGSRRGLNETLSRRVEKILAVSKAKNNSSLLLGAWGCGVFQNDPKEVASTFMAHLKTKRFRSWFKKVVFAVYDQSEGNNTYRAFKKVVG
jgi:uncharacterized protein (TIGR02452 family)